MLIQKLHELADRLGVKPAVFDAFLAAVAYAAFNLIVYGDLDLSELRLAAGVFLLGLVGVMAPAAAGVDQRAVLEARPDLRRRSRRGR